MIPFSKPPHTGNEERHVSEAMRSGKMSGDGEFSRRCEAWFQETLGCAKALLTPSCTQALEMAAILIDIREGDEIIMPSFTFPSSANAFALRGAKPVFVDVRPDTLNIDERLLEAAVTERTKAVLVMHYAGVSCAMDEIMEIARRHDLFVIEDAAQCMGASYKSEPLGTIGHLGAYSFHDTKNITSGGEGGLLIVNDDRFVQRAEIIREKGTNRSRFLRGEVDRYSWVDVGTSGLPGELQAAYLWGQLEKADEILSQRKESWNAYATGLRASEKAGHLRLPVIPEECSHNAHIFHVLTNDAGTRADLLAYLKARDIHAIFHYVPLHSSEAGMRLGRFAGTDTHTTDISDRIVRLPLYHGITHDDLRTVIDAVTKFFTK